jgi:YcaO-like protein with predicted kinase domain
MILGATSRDALLGPSSPKQPVAGGSRIIPPEETWHRIKPLLRDFGITRVGDITGLDRIAIPVWIAVRPNSRTLSVSQGKGADPWSARVSATMEAIELGHAERPNVALQFSSYSEICSRAPVVDVTALPGVRNSLFGAQRPAFWTEARDLLSGAIVWVPYEMVHADATVPWMPGSGSFLASTNGLASGNVVPEAILHGICEVIERDALALWEYAPSDAQASRRLDLEGVNDAVVLMLLEQFRAARITPMAWNITSDIQVPAIRVVIFDETADTERHPFPAAFGAGCHPDRAVALVRALTEAAQSRLTVIAGSRDDFGRIRYRTTQSAEALDHHRALARASPGTARFEKLPSFVGATVDEDVECVVRCLRSVGIDRILFVDLSLDAVPISVVRVIIPRLEGPTEAASYVPGARVRALLRDGSPA